MLRKVLKLTFVTMFAMVPAIYAQELPEIKAMACLPPEGDVETNLLSSYVSAVDGAFTKAGYRMADRNKLQKLVDEMNKQQSGGVMNDGDSSAKLGKLMKVSHFAEVTVNNVKSTAKDGALGASLKGVFGEAGTKIRLAIKIIDIESGIVLTTGNSLGTSASDPEKVAEKLVTSMEKEQAKKAKQKKA